MAPMHAAAPERRVTRALLLALWIVAATVSPFAPPLAGGLLFVPLAVLVLAYLPAARPGGVRLGARRVWESASRASWATGALVAIVLVVRALSLSLEGIEAIATGMALAFVPGVAGLALAGMAMAVALRLPALPDSPAPRSTSGGWNAWLGQLLFLWLVGWAALAPGLGHRELPFEPGDYLLHGPALLVLAGATLVFALMFGGAWRRLAPVALALAGTVAALVGLTQALLGMARVSIALVTAGLQSVTTACFVALTALALLSPAPREQPRDERAGTERTATNVAYALFPLVSLLLLAIAVVMVLTPMTRPA